MATFYSALLALGTGSGSAFVELSGNGYARAAVNFGTPDSSGRSECLSTATWTPSGAWAPVTQLGIADAASGAILATMNFTNPISFTPNTANTIAASRLSISLPQPFFSASLVYDSGVTAGEIGGSATVGHVGLGADTVILTPAAAVANLLAGG